jgi:hypothetical protein
MTDKERQQEAAGALLAAEADLLHACGWVPFVVNGQVKWRDYNGSGLMNQFEAINRQKRRMNLHDDTPPQPAIGMHMACVKCLRRATELTSAGSTPVCSDWPNCKIPVIHSNYDPHGTGR